MLRLLRCYDPYFSNPFITPCFLCSHPYTPAPLSRFPSTPIFKIYCTCIVFAHCERASMRSPIRLKARAVCLSLLYSNLLVLVAGTCHALVSTLQPFTHEPRTYRPRTPYTSESSPMFYSCIIIFQPCCVYYLRRIP